MGQQNLELLNTSIKLPIFFHIKNDNLLIIAGTRGGGGRKGFGTISQSVGATYDGAKKI